MIRLLKFYSLSVLDVLSLLCSSYLLYQLKSTRNDRQKYSNHLIMSLLVVSVLTCLFDVPLILFYLWTGRVLFANDLFCQLWNFVDLSFYGLISLFMCWISVERYLFIFSHRYQTNARQIKCFRFYALFVLPAYIFTFYFCSIFAHRCVNSFHYDLVVCGELCYYSSTRYLAFIDQYLNNIIPSVFITVLNFLLFVRVLWQKKYRMRQAMTFQQHRRMVLQLVPVAVLYLSGVLPYGALVSIYLLGFSSPFTLYLQGHCFYLFYYIAVLLPFICLISLPKVYSRLTCHRRIDVQPTILQARTVQIQY